jgi:hypothetical protein
MENAEEVTFEWTEREDRCQRCGGGMDQRRTDLHLASGRVILRDVPLYVCRTPGCENTQSPSLIRRLADQLEALVQEMLPIQQVSPPEPSLVREERPPYGEKGSEDA